MIARRNSLLVRALCTTHRLTSFLVSIEHVRIGQDYTSWVRISLR